MRYWVSTAVAVIVIVVGVAITFRPGSTSEYSFTAVVPIYFAGWITYALCFSIMTWIGLRPLNGSSLTDLLRESEPERQRHRRAESMYGVGGPTGAVLLCAVALTAVLAVARYPELRTVPAIALTVTTIAVTWLLLTLVYTVHYAREDVNRGGLVFPEESQPPSFIDYFYLAVQTATGYSSSDVTATTSTMRRSVAIHTIISFVFNAVVIAVLVSILISISV